MTSIKLYMLRVQAELLAKKDRGASALEWALIAAIVVAAAVLIGNVVFNRVQDAANRVGNAPLPGN